MDKYFQSGKQTLLNRFNPTNSLDFNCMKESKALKIIERELFSNPREFSVWR